MGKRFRCLVHLLLLHPPPFSLLLLLRLLRKTTNAVRAHLFCVTVHTSKTSFIISRVAFLNKVNLPIPFSTTPFISVHLLIKSSTCRVVFVGTQLHYNPSIYHLHGFMIPVPEAAVTVEQQGPPSCSVPVCLRTF